MAEAHTIELPKRRCEACGRTLAPGAGILSRARNGVLRTLCEDCRLLMSPPQTALGRESPPTGSVVIEADMNADPRAATVELPPPARRAPRPATPPGDSGDLIGVVSARRQLFYHRARIALYVALAALAGVVAGIVFMAIAGQLA
jgi:hypothetical protein